MSISFFFLKLKFLAFTENFGQQKHVNQTLFTVAPFSYLTLTTIKRGMVSSRFIPKKCRVSNPASLPPRTFKMNNHNFCLLFCCDADRLVVGDLTGTFRIYAITTTEYQNEVR